MKALPKPVIYSTVSQYAKLEDGYLFTLRKSGWYAWEQLSKSKSKYPIVKFNGMSFRLHRLKHCLDIKADIKADDVVHHRDNVQSNNACDNLIATDQRTNVALDKITTLPQLNHRGKYMIQKRMCKSSVIRGVSGEHVTVFNYSCATPEEYWRVLDIYNKYFGVCGKYYQNVLAAVESDNLDRAEIKAFMKSKM